MKNKIKNIDNKMNSGPLLWSYIIVLYYGPLLWSFIVQRMGKKTDRKPSRDLIVQFKKKETRNSFYKERKKTFENDLQSRVYINEHLTSYRSNLFFAARKLMKSKKLHSAWSQHGNILIRRDESDNPKQVNTHKDLAPFQGIEDEDNDNSTSDEISDGDDSD